MTLRVIRGLVHDRSLKRRRGEDEWQTAGLVALMVRGGRHGKVVCYPRRAATQSGKERARRAC